MLDPGARRLLDGLSARGVTDIETWPMARRRAVTASVVDLAGPGQVAEAVDEVGIPGPGGTIPARVYRPARGGSRPIVVYFHGGGWTTGDLETGDATCRALAAGADAVVVNVGYRLAPETPFPAGCDDAYAATRWAQNHAAQIGGDAARLAVAGESAGGNLAAATSLRFRDEALPPLRFQLLIYPALDSSMSLPSYSAFESGYFLTRTLMAASWAEYAGTRLDDPYASPMYAEDLRGLPPALVICAEFDPLRDEGEAYARRLCAAGVQARASCYPGMIHGFVSMAGVFDDAIAAVDECVVALREALR
jgi:acetyl esterase